MVGKSTEEGKEGIIKEKKKKLSKERDLENFVPMGKGCMCLRGERKEVDVHLRSVF